MCVPRAEGGSQRVTDNKFSQIMKLMLTQLWAPSTFSKAYPCTHSTGLAKSLTFYSSIFSKNSFARTFCRPLLTIPESLMQNGPATLEPIGVKPQDLPPLGTIPEPSALIMYTLYLDYAKE